MRNLGKIAILAMSLGALAGQSGCVLVAAGAGAAGAAYVMGELEATLPGTPQAVVQASEAVLKDMEMREITSSATGVDGKVTAKTALDKKLEVTVKRHDDKTSKISIRVGAFGDQQMSRDILERIKARL